MLSARAYSFRLKSRLSITLGWVSGYVNVTTFLACGTMTSHVTGNLSIALLRDVEGQRELAGYAAFAVGAFFLGAVISAQLIEGARRTGWTSKYVAPILVEALLLLWVAVGLRRTGTAHADYDPQWWTLVGPAGMAMGIQNATITRISGSTVRTTHMTGVVTDLGIELVGLFHSWRDRARGFLATGRPVRPRRLLRVVRHEPSLLRILLLASLAASFVFGAAVGALAFHWDASNSMLVPVAFLLWLVWVDIRSPIADVRELDALDDPALAAAGIVRELLPADVAVFRLHHSGRKGSHRAPDFQLWAGRLPPGKRILLLALSPATRIDENAAADLREGALTLRRDGRQLVVGGITPAQFAAFERYGVFRSLPREDVYPDLEFAMARAMSLTSATAP